MKSLKITALTAFFIASFFAGYLIYPFIFPTVSVVLPTYNRAALLPHAVTSILNQTYPYFELIIVDDGSTDNTAEVIQSLMKQDRRIRLVHHGKNCGVSCARNSGNRAARGKYIAVMDSDDTSYPERFKKQVSFLNANPDATVITTNKMYDNRPSYRTANPMELLFTLHFDNIAGNPENMFRRDFIVKNNIQYNPLYIAAEDYDFWKQVVFAGGTIYRLSDILIQCNKQSDHPANYYQQMYQNRARISQEFLRRYGIDWNGRRNPTCSLLQQMAEHADRGGLLPASFLKQKADQTCQ